MDAGRHHRHAPLHDLHIEACSKVESSTYTSRFGTEQKGTAKRFHKKLDGSCVLNRSLIYVINKFGLDTRYHFPLTSEILRGET